MSKFNISSMIEAPDSVKNAVRLIDTDSLVPYKNHCFNLYEGERLDDMVRSIQQYGIMIPIIVRNVPDSDTYEILSGHNRVNAAKIVGKKNVPAVVKENLPDEFAEIYVIETNVIQRGFKELKISEQAFAVAVRYKKLFDSKKIKDINDELLYLEGKKVQSPVGTENEKTDKMSLAAKEYGLGRNTVARLLRINELTSELKAMVDEDKIGIRPAVELSYLPKELQAVVYTIIERNGIETVDLKTAKVLRNIAESYSEPSLEVIEDALLGRNEEQPKEKAYKVSVPHTAYTRYLENVPKKDIGGIIEKALQMYFESVGQIQ